MSVHNSKHAANSSHQSNQNNQNHMNYQGVIIIPNPIGMANDGDRAIWEYVVFDPTTMDTSIVRPAISANHFEFKPMMFQMLQTIGQFGGTPPEDPHLHLK